MANKFGEQLQAFARKTGEQLEDVDRGFKLDLFSRVVQNTRVDKGRMRGNWQVSTGTPAQGETGRLQSEANAVLDPTEVAKIMPFSVTYLTNNVPYVLIWEVRDGITGRAVTDARATLARAIAEND